jgi:ribose 5-phosphate isomerase B
MTQIFIAADHAGFALKQALIEHLIGRGLVCTDLGTDSTEPVDYPDFAHKLADRINTPDEVGILICGTGIGMSMAANRHSLIRCAVCVTSHMAELARRHNNANVLALGGRLISEHAAKNIVDTFLTTDYEGGRHDVRVAKIDQIGFDGGPSTQI